MLSDRKIDAGFGLSVLRLFGWIKGGHKCDYPLKCNIIWNIRTRRHLKHKALKISAALQLRSKVRQFSIENIFGIRCDSVCTPTDGDSVMRNPRKD
jgi:hypothetical protein